MLFQYLFSLARFSGCSFSYLWQTTTKEILVRKFQNQIIVILHIHNNNQYKLSRQHKSKIISETDLGKCLGGHLDCTS